MHHLDQSLNMLGEAKKVFYKYDDMSHSPCWEENFMIIKKSYMMVWIYDRHVERKIGVSNPKLIIDEFLHPHSCKVS